ncbi:hypothetical protein SAMN06296036_11323 [Pseudobacteriovorax antillogorgiicola]|uniref:Lysozyme n=2 Tax=Pseudobacteriovorax antillogorgiicola TaxID=1513793 RepID=A0A1Y6C2N0_9BACT|nr:hypothetical protein EDD56_11424 [Pseudobacteriovorax antillogorgiicola]SMF42809.1 hypothetical protein SAMN06296036_11323 [Pseudobacteriovorax antillogorgiicola]
MARYAMISGKQMEASSVAQLEAIGAAHLSRGVMTPEEVKFLTEMHNYLSELVAPATPRFIQILQGHQSFSMLSVLGSIPLIRKIMCFSMICLAGFIAISLSPDVNGSPSNYSLFENSGVNLLLNELFLIFAAGIGASFAALFKANRYLEKGTFDPIYGNSYWLRIILGIVSGTLLGMLAPVEDFEHLGASMIGPPNLNKTFNGIGRPLLAIAGGFSAALVYKILDRVVSFLDTLIDTVFPSNFSRFQSLQRNESGNDSVTSKMQDRIPVRNRSPQPYMTVSHQPNPAVTVTCPPIEEDESDPFQGWLESFIKLGEGYRTKVYKDSLGIPTIGIGCNLEVLENQELIRGFGVSLEAILAGTVELTEEQISSIFRVHCDACLADAREIFPKFHLLTDVRKIVLLDMRFNLGKTRLLKFKNMIKAVNDYNYSKAATEMKNSRWYRQVRNRGERNVYIMQQGTMIGAPHITGELESFETQMNRNSHVA